MSRVRKEEYFAKLEKYMSEFKTVFLINVDNVGSNAIHLIRQKLRGKATLLMGKNTQIRKCIKEISVVRKELEPLLEYLVGNIGLVFTNDPDLVSIRKGLVEDRIQAPAKAGGIAPISVVVPAANTGMEPGKTSFFQALGIPTKITRGTIEIVQDVEILQAGNKVGPSEAALLNMLNISPFTYGLNVSHIFDKGQIFTPEILDITDEEIMKSMKDSIADIAGLALGANVPSVASVPHILLNAFKDLLNVSLATEINFEESAKLKEILANPELLLLAAAQAAATSSSPKKGAAKEEAKEESAEESDDDMGFGLFE
eukprot:NODE_325_length_10950_cov_0.271864.p4 type:complete len:314 gc:universal NODE_325_length_10950_cov_0.271864:3173-2232(-)